MIFFLELQRYKYPAFRMDINNGLTQMFWLKYAIAGMFQSQSVDFHGICGE